MITLRDATLNDCEFFFTLRNDPDTCRFSRRSKISWEEHVKWWGETSDHRLVAEWIDGTPIGTLRVARDGIISIVVNPEQRGGGLGTEMLRMVQSEAHRRGFKKLYAEVAEENVRSQRAFLKAGWHPTMFEVNV